MPEAVEERLMEQLELVEPVEVEAVLTLLLAQQILEVVVVQLEQMVKVVVVEEETEAQE
jgi:hypothetical protein